MTEPRKRLVDATLAALHIKMTYGVSLSPVTIRSWAKRGRITRHPPEGNTRSRFDLVEVDRYARDLSERGLLASRQRGCNTAGAPDRSMSTDGEGPL